ncbi:MAG: DNA polymerase III subunit delta [Candidatus Omnitrophota bacterium]
MVKPAYLFFGGGNLDREKAEAAVRSRLHAASGDKALDHAVFYGDAARGGDITGCARTIPFLSSQRLVTVRRYERMRPEDRAAVRDYCGNPSKTTCLILETDDARVLKEFDPLGKSIEIVRLDRSLPSDRRARIRQCAELSGKTIDNDAMAALMELAGNNADLLMRETEKLITFAGQRKRITIDDVRGLVGTEREGSAFALADAIGAKSAEDAIRITNELAGSGTRSYEVIGLLSWHIRRLIKAKSLKDQGQTDDQVAAVMKVGRMFREKFISQVRNFRSSELLEKLDILLDTDIDIKTTRTDQAISLDTAVIRLCL